MSEWLFPDVRPFWADDPSESATRKDTAMTTKKSSATTTATKKETAMTTKKSSTTTTTAKETTMTETTTKKLTAEERKAATLAKQEAKRKAHDAKVAEMLAHDPKPAFDGDPVFFVNILEGERKGTKPTSPLKLTGKYAEHDRREMELLRLAASVMGWDDNSYATKTQAEKYQGHLADETTPGWEMQSGDTFWFTVYPYSAFVWETESGLPEYDEGKGAERDLYYAQKRARNLARKAKQAEREVTAAKKAIDQKPATTTAKVYRVTMPDGTVLEASSIAELKELKEMFAA